MSSAHKELDVKRLVSESKDFFPLRDSSFRNALADMLSSENEVEISFGYFGKNNSFHPNVVAEEVGRLRAFLEEQKLDSKPLYTVEFRKGEERMITFKNPSLGGAEGVSDQVLYQTKKKIATIDVPHWGYRISEAIEEDLIPKKGTTVSEFNYEIIREKNRTSFETSDKKSPFYGVRVDMTNVVSVTQNKSTSNYEIEIERTHPIPPEKYIEILEILYRILQGGFEIISSRERFAIQKRFNSFFAEDFKKKNIDEPRNKFYASFQNKPRGMKLEDLFKNKAYQITDKLDGVRKFLFIDDRSIYLINPPNGIIKLASTNMNLSRVAGTIIDGEYLDDILNVKNNSFHSFDILFFKNEDIREKAFDDRYAYLYQIPKQAPVQFVIKTFFLKDNFYDSIYAGLEYVEAQKKRGYKNDGLILQPSEDFYSQTEGKGKSTTLKWKPKELTTIDFLIRPTGINPFLFNVMISGKTNEPVIFLGNCNNPFNGQITIREGSAPTFEHQPVENAIMECAWNYSKEIFEPIRFRHDKFTPQYVDFALDIWNDIHNPISIETLEGKTLSLLRKYHNRVKVDMLNSYVKEKSTIMDIGSGRGGDLSKWESRDLSVYAIEPNEENANEFQKRFDCMSTDGNKVPNVLQLIRAGAENTKELRKYIEPKSLDAITTFFSLTFFFKSEKMLDKLIHSIDKFLKDDGMFVGALFDGVQVRKLLKKHKNPSGIAEFDSFSLKDLSEGSKKDVFKYGDAIEISINDPNSMVKNQVEYITSFEILTQKLASIGIEIIDTYLLDEVPSILPKDSAIFSSLNRAFVFQRKGLSSPKALKGKEEIPEKIIDVLQKEIVPKPKKKKQIQRESLSILQTDDVEDYPLTGHEDVHTVRIGVEGEGSCLFHAILRGFSSSYKNMSKKERREYVSKLREGFAASLTLEDFKRMGNGQTFIMLKDSYGARIMAKGVAENKVDYALLATYKKALRSCETWAGVSILPTESLIEYLSNELNIDIFIVGSINGQVAKTNQQSKKTKAVIILNLDNTHFETIGVELKGNVYTFFTWNSKLIKELSKESQFDSL